MSKIAIWVDGKPASITVLTTILDGVEALQKANDDAFEVVSDRVEGRTLDSIREVFVAEHDRLQALINDVYRVKVDAVNQRAFGAVEA